MAGLLKEYLTVSSFAELIPDFEALERLFAEMQADRNSLLSEIHAFESESERMNANLNVWKRQLAALEKEAKGWENTLPKLEKLEGGREFVIKKMRCDLKIEALNKKLARYSAYKKLKSTLTYGNYKQNLQVMDEWAEELGRWFETGVLGEGEVTYNGRVYRFEIDPA